MKATARSGISVGPAWPALHLQDEDTRVVAGGFRRERHADLVARLTHLQSLLVGEHVGLGYFAAHFTELEGSAGPLEEVDIKLARLGGAEPVLGDLEAGI